MIRDTITFEELVERNEWAIWVTSAQTTQVYSPKTQQIYTFHSAATAVGIVMETLRLPLEVLTELSNMGCTRCIDSFSAKYLPKNFMFFGLRFLAEKVKITIKKKNYIIK